MIVRAAAKNNWLERDRVVVWFWSRDSRANTRLVLDYFALETNELECAVQDEENQLMSTFTARAKKKKWMNIYDDRSIILRAIDQVSSSNWLHLRSQDRKKLINL